MFLAPPDPTRPGIKAAERDLADASALPEPLGTLRSVLAVVAHPDDESFGLGAIIAALGRVKMHERAASNRRPGPARAMEHHLLHAAIEAAGRGWPTRDHSLLAGRADRKCVHVSREQAQGGSIPSRPGSRFPADV